MTMTKKLKLYWRQMLMFLAVLGPGIITGSVDNDAGGITTYSVLGAEYGYKLLWILIPSFVVLFVVQEMNARMGMVTGKGLADLIRENFGVKLTFIMFSGLLIADLGNTTAEFAGIAGSASILGLNKYVAVPISAFFVWIIAVKGNYKTAEKIFLIFSAFLLSYIISAVMAKPNWHDVGRGLVHWQMDFNLKTIEMIVGTVGTTIAPWMQFYMQSAVIEKGLTIKDYKYSVADVAVGSLVTVVVAFFIVVACAAGLHYGVTTPIVIYQASDAAAALKPLAGDLAGIVFAAGLFIASFFAAIILPIASSFYICEAFGFEAGIDKKWHEAPAFYTLFTAMILIGVAIILIPGIPLIRITIISQVLNGIFLPIVLYSMLKLINNKDVMGKYTNGKIGNAISTSTIWVLISLTVIMFVIRIVNLLK